MTRAKDIASFKAVTENIRRSNVQITDKVYSNLKSNEIKNRIQASGESVGSKAGDQEVIELLEMAARLLKQNSE